MAEELLISKLAEAVEMEFGHILAVEASGKEQTMSRWLGEFHWYRRYPNSHPRYAITPISDSIIIFVPKYTFIVPLPQFLVDRNLRKWFDERSR